MRLMLLLVASLFLIVSCSSGINLVGVWTDQRLVVEGNTLRASHTFTKDGRVKVQIDNPGGDQIVWNGTYEVKGKEILFTVTDGYERVKGKSSPVPTDSWISTFEMSGNDELTISDPNQGKFTLVRVQ